MSDAAADRTTALAELAALADAAIRSRDAAEAADAAAHEADASPRPEPVDLTFEGLSYRLGSGRAVLRNVSGHFGHGQMSGILGPSAFAWPFCCCAWPFCGPRAALGGIGTPTRVA